MEWVTRLLSEAERAVRRMTRLRAKISKGLIEVSASRAALARNAPARAVELAQKAITTLETATTQQASLAPTLTFLARALNANGQHRDALAAADRAMALIAARQFDRTHSAPTGRALVEVAGAKLGLDDHAGALQAVTGALEHLLPTVGPERQRDATRPAVAAATRDREERMNGPHSEAVS